MSYEVIKATSTIPSHTHVHTHMCCVCFVWLKCAYISICRLKIYQNVYIQNVCFTGVQISVEAWGLWSGSVIFRFLLLQMPVTANCNSIMCVCMNWCLCENTSAYSSMSDGGEQDNEREREAERTCLMICSSRGKFFVGCFLCCCVCCCRWGLETLEWRWWVWSNDECAINESAAASAAASDVAATVSSDRVVHKASISRLRESGCFVCWFLEFVWSRDMKESTEALWGTTDISLYTYIVERDRHISTSCQE